MSKVDPLRYLYEELRVFSRNLNKDNQERRGNLVVIRSKLEDINKLKVELEQERVKFNTEVSTPEEVQKAKEYIAATEKLIQEAQTILNSRLSSCKDQTKVQKVKMGEKFDLRTAASMLPAMDGSEESTKQLIDAIELYDGFLNEEGKAMLTNYVLKIKLNQSSKLRLKRAYNSNVELVADIREQLLPKKSIAALSLELHRAKQSTKSIEEYGRSIEDLMNNLTLAQAGNSTEAAQNFNESNETIAIHTFANGLRDSEIKLVVKARNYQKLKDAINGAKEEEITKKPSESQNSYFMNRKYHNKRGNYRQNNYRAPKFGQDNKGNSNYHRNSENGFNQRNVRGSMNRGRGNFGTSRQNHRAYHTEKDVEDDRAYHTEKEAENGEEQRFFRK